MELNWKDAQVKPANATRVTKLPDGCISWVSLPESEGLPCREMVILHPNFFIAQSPHDAQIIAAELAEIWAEARCRVEHALAKHAHVDQLEVPDAVV